MNVFQLNNKTFSPESNSQCQILKILHDIRSPIQTLGIIAGGHFDDREDKTEITLKCLRRIEALVTAPKAEFHTINMIEILMHLKAQKKLEYDVDLKFKIQVESPWFELEISEGSLTELLSNLLDNSIHADCSGNILVKVTLKDKLMIISIIDHGIGITKEKLSKLGVTGVTFSKNGSGIGLASSIEKINELGGQLSCHTITGHGTKMTIKLPIKSS